VKEIVADKELVAYCGLYCGACGAYLRGRCPGCHKNEKATWCKLRLCCIEKKRTTCADCTDFSDVKQCGKYHNIISRVIGFLFRSNRPACIARIKKIGPEAFAKEMASKKAQSLPR
jgi:hypothetical protein